MILPVMLLVLAILSCGALGFVFNLMLNGKHDPIIYIIAGEIIVIAIGFILLLTILFYLKVILQYIRNREIYEKFQKELEKLPKIKEGGKS